MSSARFGAPTYDEERPAVPGQSGDAGTQAAPEIDEDDPRLTSEVMDVNTEGDAYAFPPPPPDGNYRVRLKLTPTKVKVSGKDEDRDFKAAVWGEAKTPCYVAAIEASICDPSGKYDGIKLYDHNVATFMGRDKSTKVQTILSKLVKPDGTKWFTKGATMTQKAWMELFVKALSGEPECGIESNWGFSCQKCGEEAEKRGEKRPREILGMHKFPPAKSGSSTGLKFDHEMRCAVNPAHGYQRARPQIVRFLAISELK